MSYSLFLDDERMPRDVTWVTIPTRHYIIVRSYEMFVETVRNLGIPSFVTFDHDLFWQDQGKTDGFIKKTGLDCVRHLVEKCRSEKADFPEYQIHTLNPVGAERMRKVIEDYQKEVLFSNDGEDEPDCKCDKGCSGCKREK